MTLLPPSTKGLILDMDGVLWEGDSPLGDLPAIFDRIRQLGLRVALATNNSSRTVEMYLERLKNFGVELEPWQVVTSALAVANLLCKHFPAGAPLFAIGEQGVVDALQAQGYRLMSVDEAENAEAVVMGIDRQINFRKLSEATLLVRRGKPFFATNPDKTFPTPRGQIPGAGAYISVITTATEVEPTYAGKPYPYLLELALERLGTPREATFVVGDRLETDIAGGQNIGCPTAVVLSGVCTAAQAAAWAPKIDIIVESLTHLIGA